MTSPQDWKQGPRIFISYSSRDRVFVNRLVSDFASSNLRFWIDQEEIDVGDSIPQRISEGLNSCDVFLVILSPHSVQSEWVRRELESAIVREIDDKNLEIIPILVGDCRIPPLLRAKRFADFRKSYPSGLVQLLDALHEIMEQRQSAEQQQGESDESAATRDLVAQASRLWQIDNSFAGITPKSADDGTVLLAPEGVPTVKVTIVFSKYWRAF